MRLYSFGLKIDISAANFESYKAVLPILIRWQKLAKDPTTSFYSSDIAVLGLMSGKTGAFWMIIIIIMIILSLEVLRGISHIFFTILEQFSSRNSVVPSEI